jgi:hypothetical protein
LDQISSRLDEKRRLVGPAVGTVNTAGRFAVVR